MINYFKTANITWLLLFMSFFIVFVLVCWMYKLSILIWFKCKNYFRKTKQKTKPSDMPLINPTTTNRYNKTCKFPPILVRWAANIKTVKLIFRHLNCLWSQIRELFNSPSPRPVSQCAHGCLSPTCHVASCVTDKICIIKVIPIIGYHHIMSFDV